VLAHETDITATVDPFAGSYAVEAMTDEVETAALELMAAIEDMGGAVAAIERGYQKNEIEKSAYQTSQEIDSGDRVVVGVNKYAIDDDDAYEPLRVDPSIGEQQAERLAALRADRNNSDVTRALDALRRAAEGDENVLPPMREALAARTTVGEVCNALREVWGTYKPADAL
jgi:methylmalonyl-CoA mutase N-terminal domain/subunit